MADDKIVALPGVTIQPSNQLVANKEVVDTLEYVLGRAKAGEVAWVGLAWVTDRSIAHTMYAPNLSEGPVAALLTSAMGAASYLDKRIADAALGGATLARPDEEEED